MTKTQCSKPSPKWLVMILFFVSYSQLTFAQSNAEIKNVDFTVKNDSLFVTYELDNAKKHDRFLIQLKISTDSGKVIVPYALSGDIGSNISGGKTKQIIWDINKDNVVIDDEIAVEVIASIQEIPPKFVSRGKAGLLSALVPGLGLTKLNNGGIYWVMAIAVYGSAAGSFLYYSLSDQTYAKYLDAQTESERNSFYSTVQGQKTMSNVLMYTAGAIWLGNIIWTLVSPNKTKPGDKGISFGGSYDPISKGVVFSMKYKF